MFINADKYLRPLFLFEEDKGGGSGGEPPKNPVTDPVAAAEIAKAYEKLRAAEAERDTLKSENRTLKSQIEDQEALKTAKTAAENERDSVQREFNDYKLRGDLTVAAEKAGFVNPKAAVDLLLFRGADLSDEAKTTEALKNLAAEPGMVAAAPPSGGPVNPQNGEQPQTGHAFNNQIRAAAGRPTSV